jgi:hypothetical protein
VFAWDAGRRRFQEPLRGESSLRASPRDADDVLYGDMQAGRNGDALAVWYTAGFGLRTGTLAVTQLGALPFAQPVTRAFQGAPEGVGPFAAPEGDFLMVFPGDVTADGAEQATWARFPDEVTMAGPPARRVAWRDDGSVVYAADWKHRRVHALDWPDMNPVTHVTIDAAPLDIDVHPTTGDVAVITADGLLVFDADFAQAVSAPIEGLPWRVRYWRAHDGELLAVLNQDATVSFFDPAGNERASVTLPGVGFDMVEDGRGRLAVTVPHARTVHAISARLVNQRWQIETQYVIR